MTCTSAPDYFVRLAEIFEPQRGRVLRRPDPASTIRPTCPWPSGRRPRPGAVPPRRVHRGRGHPGLQHGVPAGGARGDRRVRPDARAGTPFICEDVDLAAARRRRGGPVAISRSCWCITTTGGRPRAEEAALARDYGLGRGAYFAKFILDRRTSPCTSSAATGIGGPCRSRCCGRRRGGRCDTCSTRLFASGAAVPRVPVRPPDPTRQAVGAG